MSPIVIDFRDMVVAVDLEHSESLVSADRSGLFAETVTLDGTGGFEISFRSEDCQRRILRSPFVRKIFLKTWG